MLNFEIDNYLSSIDGIFNNFYEFECFRVLSPQIRYNYLDEDDDYITLKLIDFYNKEKSWLIRIKKGEKP